MASLFARPKMLSTKTAGLRVGWRQGLHEKSGVGALFISVLGETEYELSPVPKTYYKQLCTIPDPENLMNQLMRMYS